MLDPVFIASLGTFFCVLMLKTLDHFLKKPKAIETAVDEDDALNAPVSCLMYWPRLIQEKMVAAGVIDKTEVAVCDNLDCENCQPTRKAIAMQPDSGYNVVTHNMAVGAITANEMRTETYESVGWKRVFDENGQVCDVVPKGIEPDYEILADEYVNPIAAFKNNPLGQRLYPCSKCGWLTVNSKKGQPRCYDCLRAEGQPNPTLMYGRGIPDDEQGYIYS